MGILNPCPKCGKLDCVKVDSDWMNPAMVHCLACDYVNTIFMWQKENRFIDALRYELAVRGADLADMHALTTAVQVMREAQKKYFKLRTNEALRIAKTEESLVDKTLESIKNRQRLEQGALL